MNTLHISHTGAYSIAQSLYIVQSPGSSLLASPQQDLGLETGFRSFFSWKEEEFCASWTFQGLFARVFWVIVMLKRFLF